MMPTSGVVPIPCFAAREGVVELPADLKCLSKLLGARARQDARRKVLEHVALGHGNRVVVQRKSPPLVGITLLPVASLLSAASTAASLPISIGALDPSSPGVEVEVAVVKERSWLCHACTYEQDFVPGSRTCVMCNTTRRRLHGAPQIFFGESSCPLCGRGIEANRTVPTVVSVIGVMPACLLTVRNASMIYGQMQTLKVH
jgi:hypothetical protein